MPDDRTISWRRLENRRTTVFLLGSAMFVVAAALTVVQIATGAERVGRLLGQAFIGAGWATTSIGLLGLYPRLADRSRWLARAGAVFATVGAAGSATVGAVALASYAGLAGDFETYLPLLLPLVLIGTLLPFPTFGAAVLRTGAYPRIVGALLLAPTVVFVTNLLTPNPPTLVLAFVTGLACIHFAIGYLLGRERVTASRDRVEQSGEPTTR